MPIQIDLKQRIASLIFVKIFLLPQGDVKISREES